MSKLPTIGQLSQLVGNPDVYAVQTKNGYVPVYEKLDNKVLARHLSGDITVGTYINHKDLAKTLVFDIDQKDTGLEAAKIISDSLSKFGVPSRSIGIEFSGSKGYHVWVVMATHVPATSLRRLGRVVLADTNIDCEVFPKQDVATKLGNLVKLPAGIHKGSGQRATMLSHWPQPMGLGVLKQTIDKLPQETIRTSSGEAPPTLECLAAIQEGPEEGWRNHGLFHFATMCRRMGLTDDYVRMVVTAANDKASPKPLDQAELDQLLESSSHSGPICSTLPKNIQCENCPIRRTKGLYAKPGQIRHGGEGELAVVEIGKRRKNGDVELIHPDLTFGLVSPQKVPPRG